MYAYNLALRFREIVEQYPLRTSLWFNEYEQYAYADLDNLANRLARFLLQSDLNAGEVLCLSGIKTVYTYALMLACLKIGVAYSVFDPDSPVDRLRKVFLTCRPKVVIAERELLEKLHVELGESNIVWLEQNDENLAACTAGLDGDNLARISGITGANPSYIMFTSGSTGFPKGAIMTHANVLNLIAWSQETYGIVCEDILTNVNPLYFDNSVFDFYSALFNGACLVPFSKKEVRDPRLLVEKIDAARCTLWFSVPSLLIFLQTMKATDGRYLRSIKRFIFGGEGYPKAKLKALFTTYSDTSAFFNVSGPTECTCICSSYRLTEADFEDVQGFPSLGSIAANFSYLILDDDNTRVVDGELGELCLLGPNVGLGYYNEPERTAASFIQNPYNIKFREIMYKTGDLVRLDPADGKLYIYGRKDNQVKHMGYRIELEEIENALHRIDYVTEAIVLHSNRDGLSRLVAVVASHEQLDDGRLRQDLRRLVPDYMIPAVFYREEVLPKNPNGKVDRKYVKEKYLSLDERRKV